MNQNRKPNYALRQIVALFLLLAFAGVFAHYVDKWVTTDYGGYDCPESVIVRPGDTVWSLIHDSCTGDLRPAIRESVDAYGTALAPGHRFYFPVDNG